MAAPQDSSLQQDGRRAPRRVVVKLIWYKTLGEGFEGVARSCDVSASGIGLRTTQVLGVGTDVFVELITASGSISCVSKVVHCRADGDSFRVGLQLDTMPPNDRAAWKRLVDEGR